MTLEDAYTIRRMTPHNGFTLEDLRSEKTFEAMCVRDKDYPTLTEGVVYSITMGGSILPSIDSTIVDLIADDGKNVACHAMRFVKIREVVNEEEAN